MKFGKTSKITKYYENDCSHVISPVTVPRKSPRKRIYQDDQYQSFMNYDLINRISDMEESRSPAGFLFQENNDCATF